MGDLRRVAIIVPCFNEARRLRRESIELLLEDPRLVLVLVDDGSTDGTPALLRAIAEGSHGRVTVERLDRNRGKGEAVRQGLRVALTLGVDAAGYVDADFATPPHEVLRLIEVLDTERADGVLGSRVAVMGARIERRPVRHYLGRVFATFASLALRERVYDTQCGAKIFRAGPALARALDAPFQSRWVFDVELLGRLRDVSSEVRLIEVPLREWRDVAGSKLRASSMARAGLDLLALGARRRARRE